MKADLRTVEWTKLIISVKKVVMTVNAAHIPEAYLCSEDGRRVIIHTVRVRCKTV